MQFRDYGVWELILSYLWWMEEIMRHVGIVVTKIQSGARFPHPQNLLSCPGIRPHSSGTMSKLTWAEPNI